MADVEQTEGRRGEPIAPTSGDIDRTLDPMRRRPTRDPEDDEDAILGDDGP